MITNRLPRPVSILPELTGIVLLGVVGLTPLIVSSGVELVDRLFFHRPPDGSLPSFEFLVGLDAWLHWMARILIGAGLANVVLRRVGPLVSFRLRMAEGTIRAPEPGTDLHRFATRYNRLSSIRVLPAHHGPVAFTSGIFSPRIYVSEALLEALDALELELLLVHEVEHCRARDPARSFITTILADLFFWLPAVRMLAERVMSRIEFGADDAAAALGRDGLAQTILKVAALGAARAPAGVVPFARTSHIACRVRRLIRVDDRRSQDWVAPRTAIGSTVIVLLALWTLGFTAYGTHHAHQDKGARGDVDHALLVSVTPG